MNLNDAKTIVTGAASGMGRHFCIRLAEAGGDVAAFDIDPEGLQALQADTADLPGNVYPFTCDVSNEDSVVDSVKAAAEALGGLNAIINNAGLFRDQLLVKKDKKTGDIRKMSLDTWQKVIDVDLTGPFLCTREFAAYCVENDIEGGVIVNISSVSRAGNLGQSNYSAAKAGLVADTRVWAKELSRYKIRCGAIAPGFIHTPILDGMPKPALDKLLGNVFLRRMGQPDEIWLGVKFIIECDYFTGRCIEIDGGISM